MKILGICFTDDQVAAMERAMWHELADRRGYTWYNHVAARAIVHEGFPDIRRGGKSIAAYAATRLLKRAQRAGAVRHIGAGKWQRAVPEGFSIDVASGT